MEQAKLDRISALSKLARTRQLSADEAAERETLRAEYRAAMRGSLAATLESCRVLDEHGNKVPLQKRAEGCE